MPIPVAASVATLFALPFAQPLSDSDLARTVAMAAPASQQLAAVQIYSQPSRLPIAEIVDCWWAYSGSELIANALRPAPAVPAGLESLRLGSGALTLDIRINVVASPSG